MRVDDIWHTAPPGAVNVLAHLNGSAQGEVLRGLLINLLCDLDEQNRHLSGDELYRSQGRAQAVAALMEALTTARERQT
jgi:hypothetical protein